MTAFVTVAVLLAVGALWWWALLGMTPEVGLAVVSTAWISGKEVVL